MKSKKYVAKWIRIALSIMIMTVLTILSSSSFVEESMAKIRKIPVYSVETDNNDAAISFDAAWGADKTIEILNLLDKYKVKATFFLVGFWVDKYPEMVKDIYKRGHLVGNHSTNHLHANTLTKEQIAKEIETTNNKISQLIGEDPKFFRAPFGEYNDRLLEFTDSAGIKVIQWDVDSLDWKDLSGGQIADRVVPKAQKGSIILFHNNSKHILDALPIVLLGLKNKGLNLVRMDELVIANNYYIDNSGKQIKKTT